MTRIKYLKQGCIKQPIALSYKSSKARVSVSIGRCPFIYGEEYETNYRIDTAI